MTAERDFSDELEDWLRADTPKTVGALGAAFGERGFAVTILLLMFLPALPLPTGGITHVFELITILLALQMVLGRRTLWLPRRFKDRELGASITQKAVPFIGRRIRWFERFSKPRLAGLFEHRWFIRILGLVIIVFTIGAVVAPPFSGLDTLPAMGAVAVTLAIILEDVIVLAIGITIGTGGVIVMLTVGAALVRVVKHIL